MLESQELERPWQKKAKSRTLKTLTVEQCYKLGRLVALRGMMDHIRTKKRKRDLPIMRQNGKVHTSFHPCLLLPLSTKKL